MCFQCDVSTSKQIDAAEAILLHEGAVNDNGFCAKGSSEFGEGRHRMYEAHAQVLHGETKWGCLLLGTMSLTRLLSRGKLFFGIDRFIWRTPAYTRFLKLPEVTGNVCEKFT